MGRTKGSLNRQPATLSPYSLLKPEARVNLLANLIVDKILQDQNNQQKLLRKIKRLSDG